MIAVAVTDYPSAAVANSAAVNVLKQVSDIVRAKQVKGDDFTPSGDDEDNRPSESASSLSAGDVIMTAADVIKTLAQQTNANAMGERAK